MYILFSLWSIVDFCCCCFGVWFINDTDYTNSWLSLNSHQIQHAPAYVFFFKCCLQCVATHLQELTNITFLEYIIISLLLSWCSTSASALLVWFLVSSYVIWHIRDKITSAYQSCVGKYWQLRGLLLKFFLTKHMLHKFKIIITFSVSATCISVL